MFDLPVRNVPADNPSLTINAYSADGDDCDGQIADFQVFSIYDAVSSTVSAVVFLDRYTVDSANEAMVRAIARNN